MTNERKVKPRSKAEINKPLNSVRIKGRIERLKQSREKALARGNTKKVKSIDESIAKYRAQAKEIVAQLSEV